jgi:hypothetical protein
MKNPKIDPEELENDMNKVLSFINNLENMDIEDASQLNKLMEQAESMSEIFKTKYKNHLDDTEQSHTI